MATRTRTSALAADLQIAIERDDGPPLRAHLHGRDNRLTLSVDEPSAFAGRSDAAAIATLADTLARTGVVIRVEHRGDHMITLGAVWGRWWQRRLTGSRHIRLGSARGLWVAAKARAKAAPSVLPDVTVMPPSTPWPPVPTFQRRVRRHVTTTEDPYRGGAARLVLTRQDMWAGERQPIYWLADGTTIGSEAGCDVRLAGLEATHARVRHTDDDEWVVEAVDGAVRVHGEAGPRHVLRTGARVKVGEHVLVYFREEYADHGRPHGGRIGGELGRQLPQHPATGDEPEQR